MKNYSLAIILGLFLSFTGCSDNNKNTYEIGESCKDDLNFSGCNEAGTSSVRCNSDTKRIEEAVNCGDTGHCTSASYEDNGSITTCFFEKCDKPNQEVEFCTSGLREGSEVSLKQYEIQKTSLCLKADDGNAYLDPSKNTNIKMCSGRCSDGCPIVPCVRSTDEPKCTEEGLAMNCNSQDSLDSHWTVKDCTALGAGCVIQLDEAVCIKE